ncbi:MAG TPA: metallophosphoesterase family protein [Stellaceae bacterium]|nr:metallophosphoesterase family protein [Stellaceae bacterium]
MFGLWSQRKRRLSQRPAELPPGQRIYAVGDIHGRADLLSSLRKRIDDDARAAPELDKRVVFLGDYVDRGPSSRDVLEMLMAPAGSGPLTTCLLGNHEAMLLQFLDDVGIGPEWMAYGGRETLLSYGASAPGGALTEAALRRAQEDFRARFPVSHREFLSSLPRQFTCGDYFFAHAGVRPGVALERQSETDLIWIRDEFLQSDVAHGKIIVHGHSYKHTPEIRPNRIGIDTGAYATGQLTCLVLEGQDRRFL